MSLLAKQQLLLATVLKLTLRRFSGECGKEKRVLVLTKPLKLLIFRIKNLQQNWRKIKLHFFRVVIEDFMSNLIVCELQSK
jgi:hypothetical protein